MRMRGFGCHSHKFGCHGGRCFPTREEKIEMLEEYKKILEKEAKGVEETIEILKKKKE